MTKRWLSFEEQLELLQSRDMQIDDSQKALNYLQRIGYYRLSGYWYPLRKFADKTSRIRTDFFVAGTKFSQVIALYIFDKKLRFLALDALERIEMAVRVDIAHTLGERDPQAHEKAEFLHGNFTKRLIKNSNTTEHKLWLEKHVQLLKRAQKKPFIQHYNKKYAGVIPIWVAIEVWDFGCMSKLFSGMQYSDQNKIAKKYGAQNGKQFSQWLRSLNFIRNVAAHHSRLWNINFLEHSAPINSDVFWKKVETRKPFFYFCIMQKMLQVICPNSSWNNRFQELMINFPKAPQQTINLNDFGLCFDIKDWHLWQ